MMQENKRHLFGKCMLLGMVVCAGLCSVGTKAAEHDQPVAVSQVVPKPPFFRAFIDKACHMDRKRALLIAVPTVAIAICMTPSVRTLAYQGAEALHVFGLKALRILPLSQERKEALTGKIEALEAANKKRGDECPEFKIKETLDNVKWSGSMVGFTVLFLDCLLGEDATKLK